MKPPPFLLGAALVFWGWQVGLLWLGALAGLILEGAGWARWQWDLTDPDYHRLWDFCSALFVGSFLYVYLSEDLIRAGQIFVRWWPLVFFPMMAAQRLGPREQLDYRVFSWFWRRKPASAFSPDAHLNVSYLYLAVCLLASTTFPVQNRYDPRFFLGFSGLIAWSLWAHRSRQFPVWVWTVLLAGITVSAYQAQRRLPDLQNWAENQVGKWITSWAQRDTGTDQNRTALGDVGKLKLSGRILWRIETPPGQNPSPYLRQASYHQLRENTWFGPGRNFAPVTPETNDAWQLVPGARARQELTLAGFVRKGRGVLPLPSRTARIEQLPAAEMETNTLGVVRIKDGPKFVNYLARQGPLVSRDSPPDPVNDLQVPDRERAALAQISEELGLSRQSLADARQTLGQFFQEHFRYTTDLAAERLDPTGKASPLTRFLLTHRAGHCEYFAIATVMLLRQAQFPARYATGYHLIESPKLQQFVVRERHAHAWCLVWNPATRLWDDLDTTPDASQAADAGLAGAWEPLTDWLSNVWFQLTRWRYGQASWRPYVMWGLALAAVGFAWRAFRRQRPRRVARATGQAQPASAWPGLDSEFYPIAEQLARWTIPRDPNETMSGWLRRIRPLINLPWAPIESLMTLHERYRFDPAGLTLEERQTLAAQARVWLDQTQRPAPPPAADEPRRSPGG